MIANLFKNLLKMNGIEAIVIYDQDNNILDNWFRSGFKQVVFNEMGLHFRQIFALQKDMDLPFPEIFVSYDKGQVFARYFKGLVLLIITKPKTDVALLRLIVDVGFGNLEKSKKIQKALKKIPTRNLKFLEGDYMDDVETRLLQKIEILFHKTQE